MVQSIKPNFILDVVDKYTWDPWINREFKSFLYYEMADSLKNVIKFLFISFIRLSVM